MKLKPYLIQESRSSGLNIFNVPRVDYEQLLDTLHFPLIWTYDSLLESWLPSEIDFSFLKFLQSLPSDATLTGMTPARVFQLRRHGLIPQQQKSLSELQTEMSSLGFVRINQILDQEYCRSMMLTYYYRQNHLHERWPDMEGIKRTSVNNMPLMRLIHQNTESLVNKLVPEPIKTSYSFASAYELGSNLPAHTDRPQCVWNISMMLGSVPNRVKLSSWPLFIKRGEMTHSVPLEIGDAVLYSGVRDLHWRDKLQLPIVFGVFLHYVPQAFNGSLD